MWRVEGRLFHREYYITAMEFQRIYRPVFFSTNDEEDPIRSSTIDSLTMTTKVMCCARVLPPMMMQPENSTTLTHSKINPEPSINRPSIKISITPLPRRLHQDEIFSVVMFLLLLLVQQSMYQQPTIETKTIPYPICG